MYLLFSECSLAPQFNMSRNQIPVSGLGGSAQSDSVVVFTACLSVLPLAHSAPATMASLLFREHIRHSGLCDGRSFCPECCSIGCLYD